MFLNGELAPDANVFTLDGLVGPLDALSGQGEFIATVSEKGQSAAAALSALGTSKDSSLGGLSRLWFEFSKIAPGGKTTTITRDVLNTTKEGQKLVLGRPVSDQSWKSQLKLALVQSRNIGVATGPVSPAYRIAQYISASDSAKKTIDSLQQLEAQGQLLADPEIMKDIEPLPDLRMVKFLTMTNGDLGFHSGSVSYLAEPMIATFNRGVTDNKGDLRGFEQTDIVFNARRSLDLSDQNIQNDSKLSSLMGVWDTFLEDTPSAAKSPEWQSSAISQLKSRTEALQLVTPEQSNELSKLNLDPSVLLLANNELEAGYGLIIPGGTSTENPAWWRVDMSTGTVTGMALGPGGYGGDAAEYLMYISMAIATYLMWLSFYNCWENETGVALFCCLLDSWITNILVAVLAFMVAQMLSAVLFAGITQMGLTFAAATKEAALATAIITAITLDVGGTVLSFTDFRISACGTLTGSG